MFDSERLCQTKHDAATKVGAGRFLFTATEDHVAVVQSGTRSKLGNFYMSRSEGSLYLMSNNLALALVPLLPLLKKLRAIRVVHEEKAGWLRGA